MKRQLIAGLLLFAMLAPSSGCGVAVRGVDKAVRSVATSRLFHRGRTGALTPQEREWAAAAWRYFDVNRQPETGLVASVAYTSTVTMWQIADYIAALIAARELRLIDATQFDERFRRVTHFLNVMELYDGRVPNRTYHTASSKPLNDSNVEGPQGWSAIDLGRLLLCLRIARDRYPQYAEYTDEAILRWNFCDVIDRDGVLHGGVHADGKTNTFEEGRLGYEEYAAAGFRAWGFTTTRASSLEPIETVRIYGIDLPIDARDPRVTGMPAPVVTLPWVLFGLELDWRDDAQRPLEDIAALIYRIQEERFRREKIYTARTDHPIGRAPWFIFDSVHAGGYPFNTTTPDGAHQPQSSLVSTRAAFGLWALWNTDYTTRLMTVVGPLHNKERGWFEGRFRTHRRRRGGAVVHDERRRARSAVVQGAGAAVRVEAAPPGLLRFGARERVRAAAALSAAAEWPGGGGRAAVKRCVTSVAIAIVMAAGYATAQTPPPENEGRAILDGLASSFAVPWRDLLKGKHNSEWRNLFDGFTGEFGIDGPLKPPDVPGRTTPLRWSDARLSASVKYTPLGYWFVNATAYHYLNEDNQRAWSPDFTYGFGYFDWHPRTFSVQYNNYAGNRYPWRRGSRAGFRDGSVSLTWSWSS